MSGEVTSLSVPGIKSRALYMLGKLSGGHLCLFAGVECVSAYAIFQLEFVGCIGLRTRLILEGS